jgi:RNA polymerase sigma factor (TIGR02999 family)
MSDVTRLLSQFDGGDPSASEKLLPLVYDELRKLAAARMAAEPPDHTLHATALVHEAYLRLVGGAQPQQWNGRAHFFGAAAEAMRRILVESATRRSPHRSQDLSLVEPAILPLPRDDLLDFDDALIRLEKTRSPGRQGCQSAGLRRTEHRGSRRQPRNPRPLRLPRLGLRKLARRNTGGYSGGCHECTQGLAYCSGTCTDVAWDPDNCGGCGNTCSGPDPHCYDSVCYECVPGQSRCGDTCT